MFFPSLFLLPCFRPFRARLVSVYAHCKNILDLVAQFVALTLLYSYILRSKPLDYVPFNCDLVSDDVRGLKHGRVLSRILPLAFFVRCKESKLLSLHSFFSPIKYCFCSVGHRLFYSSHSLFSLPAISLGSIAVRSFKDAFAFIVGFYFFCCIFPFRRGPELSTSCGRYL